eukprot:2731435-Rhodomonas_salina.1
MLTDGHRRTHRRTPTPTQTQMHTDTDTDTDAHRHRHRHRRTQTQTPTQTHTDTDTLARTVQNANHIDCHRHVRRRLLAHGMRGVDELKRALLEPVLERVDSALREGAQRSTLAVTLSL